MSKRIIIALLDWVRLLCFISSIILIFCSVERQQLIIPSMGILFVGIIMTSIRDKLLTSIKTKQRRISKLIRENTYVWADITDIKVNKPNNNNEFTTYTVECLYINPLTRISTRFKSHNLTINPNSIMKRNIVKVFVDKSGNMNNYYVDVGSAVK